LDVKVEEIIGKHEQDFLSAFRVHMYGLQKQLLDLRKQLQEKESDMFRDQQINTLTKTVQWFHEEGLRFSEILTRTKQEAEKWKAKAQTLEFDNAFLERQVKTLKRKQRLFGQLYNQPVLSGIEKIDPTPPSPRQDSTKSTSPVRSMELDMKTVSHPAVAELVGKYGLKDTRMCKDIDDIVKGLLTKSSESVKHLQTALERMTRKLQVLTMQKTQQCSIQTEMQRIFVDCVEEVRSQRGRKESVQMDTLLPTEKRTVMEMFCNNEDVFREIYDRLFPPPKSNSPFAMKSTPSLPRKTLTQLTSAPITDHSPSNVSPKRKANLVTLILGNGKNPHSTRG
jgi:hypothetical protein